MGEKDNNSAFDSSSMPEEACTVFCKYTGHFPLKNVSAVTVGEKRNIADKDMYVFAWENRWIKCIWFFLTIVSLVSQETFTVNVHTTTCIQKYSNDVVHGYRKDKAGHLLI